jgi:hypothetical protein
MLIEYKEQVLEKESTHINIKSFIQETELIVIGDLIIKTEIDGKENIEILADSRYYPASKFNLTIEDFNDRLNNNSNSIDTVYNGINKSV